jgi:hypothetical protein
MKSKTITLLSLGVIFIIYGFATHIHPWDYIACGLGGVLFGCAIKED